MNPKTLAIHTTSATITLARDLKPMESLLRPTETPPGEGQLPLDILENEREIMVVAPVAGVNFETTEVRVVNDVLTIRGERAHHIEQFDFKAKHYHTEECFWGRFSRSVILPANVDANLIQATQKDHVLYVRVPKRQEVKMKIIKISA